MTNNPFKISGDSTTWGTAQVVTTSSTNLNAPCDIITSGTYTLGGADFALGPGHELFIDYGNGKRQRYIVSAVEDETVMQQTERRLEKQMQAMNEWIEEHRKNNPIIPGYSFDDLLRDTEEAPKG